MDKPIILEIEEAKQELIQYINYVLNKHGLNCYLIEPTFAALYADVKAGAQNELAQAKAQMAAMQKNEAQTSNTETTQNDLG